MVSVPHCQSFELKCTPGWSRLGAGLEWTYRLSLSYFANDWRLSKKWSWFESADRPAVDGQQLHANSPHVPQLDKHRLKTKPSWPQRLRHGPEAGVFGTSSLDAAQSKLKFRCRFGICAENIVGQTQQFECAARCIERITSHITIRNTHEPQFCLSVKKESSPLWSLNSSA